MASRYFIFSLLHWHVVLMLILVLQRLKFLAQNDKYCTFFGNNVHDSIKQKEYEQRSTGTKIAKAIPFIVLFFPWSNGKVNWWNHPGVKIPLHCIPIHPVVFSPNFTTLMTFSSYRYHITERMFLGELDILCYFTMLNSCKINASFPVSYTHDSPLATWIFVSGI